MKMFDEMDWALLREQKESLFRMKDLTRDEHEADVIEGVLALIDAVQDEAYAQGYPVWPAVGEAVA